MQKISKNPENHAVCETVDQEEILNRVQNDSYEDLAVCQPCKLDDKKKAKNSRKKAAFTLAELLIAIGIIGIVAAITIPALHTKITKYVLKKQIRKAMSTITQNHRMAANDVGLPTYDSSNRFVYQDFNNALLNNFKWARICKGNGLKDGCVPKYEGLPTVSWGSIQEASVYNGQTIYQTMDGMIIILFQPTTLSYWLIDVNGMKGPNKAGWDLFFVNMMGSRPVWLSCCAINQNNVVKGAINSSDVKLIDIDKW